MPFTEAALHPGGKTVVWLRFAGLAVRSSGTVRGSYLSENGRSDEFVADIDDYSVLLSSLVSQNGVLISIERMDIDPLFLGWLKALNKAGLSTATEEISLMHVKELEAEHDFPIIVARAGAPVPTEELENRWLELLNYQNDMSELLLQIVHALEGRVL